WIEGASWARWKPSERDAEAWESRSTTRTRWPSRTRAPARLTTLVVLPTPPLRLTNARITGAAFYRHPVAYSASGRIPGVLGGARQQVGDSDLDRPPVRVAPIEGGPLDLEHAEHVEPLPLRRFAARSVPVQLLQDHVLGGGQTEGRAAGARRLDATPPRHLRPGESIRRREIDVDLERLGEVNQVERAAARDGMAY